MLAILFCNLDNAVMSSTKSSGELEKWAELRNELAAPWTLPIEDGHIIHHAPDRNLKADVTYELLPDELKPEWYPHWEYRSSSITANFIGPLGRLEQMAPAVQCAQGVYETIRDNFQQIPIEELQRENGWNHPLAVASVVMKNEIRIAVPEISEERRDAIAHEYWSYARRIIHADEIAFEGYE